MMQLHSNIQSRSAAASRYNRSRNVTVHALPAESSSRAPATAVALLSAAVMASAALLGSPTIPAAAADEAVPSEIVEGPFKGYSGKCLPQQRLLDSGTLTHVTSCSIRDRPRVVLVTVSMRTGFHDEQQLQLNLTDFVQCCSGMCCGLVTLTS
jgi:hypothetical protein